MKTSLKLSVWALVPVLVGLGLNLLEPSGPQQAVLTVTIIAGILFSPFLGFMALMEARKELGEAPDRRGRIATGIAVLIALGMIGLVVYFVFGILAWMATGGPI